MANRFFPDSETPPEDAIRYVASRPPAIGTVYGLRSCPYCGDTIFGMPGGRDAVCKTCGYKDPCCSD